MINKEPLNTNEYDHLSIDYYPNFFPKEQADFYFQTLYDTIAWQEESYVMYGKMVKAPRLMAWYGDEHAEYSYSGVMHYPQPWLNIMLDIKQHLQQHFHHSFNSVLANLYRNGQDSVGWHAYNEAELGPNPVIASVSLGAPRRFCFQHKKDKTLFEMVLTHGSVLFMYAQTQHYWKHALPKSKEVVEPRINLTFREVVGER